LARRAPGEDSRSALPKVTSTRGGGKEDPYGDLGVGPTREVGTTFTLREGKGVGRKTSNLISFKTDLKEKTGKLIGIGR